MTYRVEIHIDGIDVFHRDFAEHATAKRCYDRNASRAGEGKDITAVRLWNDIATGRKPILLLGTDVRGSVQLAE